MKAYDLKPTFENLLNTYCNNTIGRNTDIFRFIELLNSIEDGCSIALDGNWGSGKTFFVKQIKMILDAHNHFITHDTEEKSDEIISIRRNYYQDRSLDLQPQVCVYYDAWLNDNDEDPVMSLVYSILQSVDSDFSFNDSSFIKAGASIMEVFSGRNWTQLIDNLRTSSLLDTVKDNRNINSLVDQFLSSLLPEKGNRLIVFVDELDRCKPSYAVRLLERIKHYFSNDNITFVFSINTNELQHTIRKYYGNDFDGSRYLDRFFDLRVTLPPPDLQSYYSSLSFNDSQYVYDMVCGAVIKVYHFELREIAKYLRLAKIVAYNPIHEDEFEITFGDGKALRFCLFYIVPIILGLKIFSAKRYNDFIQGKDFYPLVEIASALSVRMFECLLEGNESYDEQIANKTNVTIEDKLKLVYDALFLQKYDREISSIKVGELRFMERTKDKLMRTCGLMSEYTKIDVD